MNKYAILANPGHNRIYFNTALKIAVSEIKAIAQANDIEIDNIGEENVGLPAAICFTTSEELMEEQIKIIGTASIYYALFEVMENGLLKPIDVPDFHTFPESMVQILKYQGKTNEQFTRLLVNLAVAACETNCETITLMDPLCGKGTTLYEGLIRGFNVKGIEINELWTQEIQTYVVRYMKEGRYKHKKQKSSKSENGKKTADIFSITAAKVKQDFIDGKVQELEVFTADTKKADLILGKSCCDIIVADLPYGVHHGSKNDKDKKMDRGPIELLKRSMPSWNRILKTRGSLVLSFNEYTMKYDQVAELLENNGFIIKREEPFNNFMHRVDQSINRNLIVAVKGKK